MKKNAIILTGKALSFAIQKLNMGNGSTWPGHIALNLDTDFIKKMTSKSQTKIVFIVGTNGKTTTTALIRSMAEKDGKKVIQNISGANLLNGIASTLLLNATPTGKINADIALFEIDENIFPLICKELTPDVVVMLNLFRDQLDRYGEVTTIANKWKKALYELPDKTKIILNADDPLIAYLGVDENKDISYFGLVGKENKNTTLEHAVDSIYCPRCNTRLTYHQVFYSHLGEWECPKCELKRPSLDLNHAEFYPLEGMYNKSNIHAALLTAKELGYSDKAISDALHSFKPAFGRQEEIILGKKKIKIILVKNPTGFNETLKTVYSLGGSHVLIALNDRVADGKDISWIWDVDFEEFKNYQSLSLTLTGDRVHDMMTRIKYANIQNANVSADENMDNALSSALKDLPDDKTLFILPTYTAMLSLRKTITGRKIL